MDSARQKLVTWVGGLKYPEDQDVLESHTDSYLDDVIDEVADPLRTAIREALRIFDAGALAVTCEACGSKPGKPCYGNGAMSPHEGRRVFARAAGVAVLREALAKDEQGPRE